MHFDLPSHVAIIPDGNGRWAKSKNRPIREGHLKGMEVLEQIIEYFKKIGIKYVTVYAFSSENWKRPENEKQGIFSLAERFFSFKKSKIVDSSTKVNILGELDLFPKSFKTIINETVEKTKNNKDFYLQVALNYGARAEITRSINLIHQDMNKGIIKDISEETISNYLYTKDIPDPDLLIRTGGAYRISNFLLYQLSYSEFFFIDKFWPDIEMEDMEQALNSFKKRERRFGGRK